MTPALRRGLMRLLVALPIFGLAGCAPDPPPNILLVVIDTLRADHLGAYGDRSARTPVLDGLATTSTLFRNAYSQSSWTIPSVASLLTSRYPTQHGVVNITAELQASEETLAEQLATAGYTTAMFTSNALVSRKLGFAQGFDHYQTLSPLVREGSDFPRKQRAHRVNAAALSWLDQQPDDAPLFLYLHYMEPHQPYDPPPETIEWAFGGQSFPDLERLNRRVRYRYDSLDAGELFDLRHVYRAEVTSVDAEIGRLLVELQQRGFLEGAVVVVTSDHGHELRDHEWVGHGPYLYEEVIRVPVIVMAPDARPGARVATVVSTIDLAPTLLDYARAAPPDAFEGRSLRALVAGSEPESDGIALSEVEPDYLQAEMPVPHRRAVVAGRWKRIEQTDDPPLFFDLTDDPEERRARRSGPAGLAPRLAAAVEESTRNPAPRAHSELDPEMRQNLEALGYLDEE